MDGRVHGGGDECVWEFDEYLEYMGNAISILSMYNRGTLRQDEFGDSSIERASTLLS